MTRNKTLLRSIDEYTHLYRDDKTGIAWVENGHAGIAHTCHANISASGSVAGMINKGYWSKDVRTVTVRGFIYNIDTCIVSDDLDNLARQHCRCGGRHDAITANTVR